MHVAVAASRVDLSHAVLCCMPDFHSKVLPLVIVVVHFTPRLRHLSIAMAPFFVTYYGFTLSLRYRQGSR